MVSMCRAKGSRQIVVGVAAIAWVVGIAVADTVAGERVVPVGRYGGDEFIAVLVGGEEAEATAVAERLLSSVSSGPVHTGGRDFEVTLSGGLASVAPGEPDLWGAIGRADAALYRSKASGRNRVSLATLEDHLSPATASRV